MITDEEITRLHRSRDLIKKMAEGYRNKAEHAADEENREKYLKYAEDLEYWFKDSDVLIPMSVIYVGDTYVCPSCKCRIGDIYEAAAEAEIPVSCCICCGQTFNGRIGFSEVY